MDRLGILLWNCQGVWEKRDELLELIDNHNSDIVALQKTQLWTNNKFEIAGCSTTKRDGHFNRTPHGGVSILVHNDIPYQVISLNTNTGSCDKN